MKRKRILVVDDDPTVRRATARILRQEGYDVETARDGAHAIILVRTGNDEGRPFGLIVSDCDMPAEDDAFRMIDALRLSDHYLPVIIVSGRQPEAIRRSATAHGHHPGSAREILLKPAVRATLLTKIREILGES